MPSNNSKPTNSLANHSDSVQFKKVVSTMVQPKDSNSGILAQAEKINEMAMLVDKIQEITWSKVVRETLGIGL